jgi:hypothetical protein
LDRTLGNVASDHGGSTLHGPNEQGSRTHEGVDDQAAPTDAGHCRQLPPQAIGLHRWIPSSRAWSNRCHRDEINARERPRTWQAANNDELALVAQASTEAWILAVPGNGPDANEASPLQGADGLAQTVVVGHRHQDPIGLELAAGGSEDPTDLGPGQAIGEPVAQMAARSSVD